MKKTFLVIGMLVTSSVFASEINLTAGGSVTLDGTKITCGGSDNSASLPSCLVMSDGKGAYKVMLGMTEVDSGISYGAAMGTVASLKANKQCK